MAVVVNEGQHDVRKPMSTMQLLEEKRRFSLTHTHTQRRLGCHTPTDVH